LTLLRARVAQEITSVNQLESRSFYFLPKKRFLDAMQGVGFGDAGTGSARMVCHDIETSRLERAKDCLAHCRAINAEMSEVVMVEHQGCEIDAFDLDLGRNGVFEGSRDRDVGAAWTPLSHSSDPARQTLIGCRRTDR